MVDAWLPAERLQKEHAVVGFYLSAHPLDEYRVVLEKMRVQMWREFEASVKRGASFGRLAGTVTSRQERIRKNALVAFQVETVGYMTSQERGYFMRDITRITMAGVAIMKAKLFRTRTASGPNRLRLLTMAPRPITAKKGVLVTRNCSMTGPEPLRAGARIAREWRKPRPSLAQPAAGRGVRSRRGALRQP